MTQINVRRAIRDVKDYLIPYMPDVGKTQIYQLGYGRLKIWRIDNDSLWVGFILPYKHDPTHENLLHLSPDELIELAFCKLG